MLGKLSAKFWFCGLAGIILLVAGYMWWGSSEPVLAVLAQTEIRASDALRQDNCYWCGDRETVYEGTAGDYWQKELSADLQADLLKMKNWHLSQEKDGTLVLICEKPSFCPEHQYYRHLQLWENNKLAVFEGPLGFDQKLLWLESQYSLQDLSTDLGQALIQARNFEALSPEEQQKCRELLEFASESRLNGFLENLDELN
ncbi:MAG: hypothetical protein MJ157_04920 [Clostridia bacterium]|nr:hypothetical protein [Clostridia bacterium]